MKPSSFVCQPAGALLITHSGEIEVFSDKCSAFISTFQNFSGIARTLSLLDEELLLLGNDALGTKERYISIQKPRDGLLMKYTVEELPLTQPLHSHSSLVSGNELTVVGGKFKSRGKYSKFTWTESALKWENGSKYIPSVAGSCSVKLGADLHILFGGERELNGQKVSVGQVVKINTTEEIAYELSPIKYSRVSHGCALLNNGLVLLSGGVSQRGTGQKAILQDELYNTVSGEVTDLNLGQSLKRAQHATLRLGDRILAFGGVDVNNNALAKISEFDITTSTWTNLDRELLSTNTSKLVVSPFPVAALDFVPHCDCAPATREGRIQGGTQAEVNKVDIKEIVIGTAGALVVVAV